MLLTAKVCEIREKAVPVFLKRPQIKRVELFGSFSKGEETEDSDIDFLIDVDPNAKTFTIMDLVKLQMELEQTLHRSVDLVERDCVTSPFMKRSIVDAPTNFCILSLC